MLVPAALIGLVCFLIGTFFLDDYVVREICHSEHVECPACQKGHYCSFKPIKEFCGLIKFSFMIDNPVTVIYSLLMSFWGVTFVILWNRKQQLLSMRWNLNQITIDRKYRSNFKKKAHIHRVSSITGQLEYYYTFLENVTRKLVATGMMIMMFCFYLLGVVAIVYYRLVITYYGSTSQNEVFSNWYSEIEFVTSPMLSFVIIFFFEMVGSEICKKITEFENPRTQEEFDTQYSFKMTILTFGNVFLPLFYLAFFKGHFYTHPGDHSHWSFWEIIKADTCGISGCLVDLSMQVMYIMVLENAWRLFKEFITPSIKVYLNYLKHRIKDTPLGFQWEEDLVLVQPDDDPLYIEYMELGLQYGFITFFVVSSPISPLLAFLNNLLEMRLDAIKILKKYRRIVIKKTYGIGEWNDILKLITFCGTISNPLLIAFSSSLILRYIYLFSHNLSMKGYINTTLSEFSLQDLPDLQELQHQETVSSCYYVGERYPPSHVRKYQRTENYWFHFAIKSIFFIVLENLCLLVSLLLERVITPIPRKVRQKRENDELILHGERIRRTLRV